MLGNSYISDNHLDTILSQLLLDAGDQRHVKPVAEYGKDLAHFANELIEPGSTINTLLGPNHRHWGYVVMQDRSHVPAFCCNGPDTKFYAEFEASLKAVKDLDDAAKQQGATTVLLQTWGRRDGAPVHFLKEFESMNDLVIRGYGKYADVLAQNGREPLVAPVGQAFGLMYDQMAENISKQQEAVKPESLWTQLYAPDGSHPSLAGSYLAACVLYATITGKSPIGLKSMSGIAEAERQALQHSAHEAVFGNTADAAALQLLEGNYTSKDPDVKGFVGEIRHGTVHWPGGVHTALHGNPKEFTMFFHGVHLTASYEKGKITWSDGDVWTRHADAVASDDMDSEVVSNTVRKAGDASMLMRSEKLRPAAASLHQDFGEPASAADVAGSP